MFDDETEAKLSLKLTDAEGKEQWVYLQSLLSVRNLY
jgi:hypothetical protein